MPSIPLRSCTTSWTLSGFADEAGDSADEQIAAVRRAGLKHVDLRGVDGFNISALPLENAEGIRLKLDAAQVRVAMFGSPIGKIDIADDFQIDLAKIEHLGELADVLGCRAVRIFSYFNKAGAPEAKWREESLGRLRRLRDRAGELGLVLYHENETHIYGDTSARTLDLVRELRGPGAPGGNPVFRAIFDFDNFNRAGSEVWQTWLEHREFVDAFHLKDSDAAGQHVPVGQGAGRVREILADALSRVWHGPLSLEPHLQHSAAVMATGPGGAANRKFAEMSRADCFQAAAEAAKGLMGEIGAPVA